FGPSLDPGVVALSAFPVYPISWSDYIDALKADAKTANDSLAVGSLPANPLSTNVIVSSANGRAIGLDTPPAPFENENLDGIVTLNSEQPFGFTRVFSATNFDALTAIEHEMDEILGLGSYLNGGGSDFRPEDLFTWSAP